MTLYAFLLWNEIQESIIDIKINYLCTLNSDDVFLKLFPFWWWQILFNNPFTYGSTHATATYLWAADGRSWRSGEERPRTTRRAGR